jgi:hypothetical protein
MEFKEGFQDILPFSGHLSMSSLKQNASPFPPESSQNHKRTPPTSAFQWVRWMSVYSYPV